MAAFERVSEVRDETRRMMKVVRCMEHGGWKAVFSDGSEGDERYRTQSEGVYKALLFENIPSGEDL